ncbi:hypothetical protein HCTV-16_gp162 [Haloarcula virus HCTV-16]|nr:hypothetical protein HCTV-16_gp162 [Haloarcula virus HCTV-16]
MKDGVENTAIHTSPLCGRKSGSLSYTRLVTNSFGGGSSMSAAELWEEHADEIDEIRLTPWDDGLSTSFWDRRLNDESV